MRSMVSETRENPVFRRGKKVTDKKAFPVVLAKHSNCFPTDALGRKQKQISKPTLLPVGSSIYSLGDKVLYLCDLNKDERCDLVSHIFVPYKSHSQVLFYVYLDEPEPCLIPLKFEGTYEKRRVKKRYWDLLGWLSGCSDCLKRKSLCEVCRDIPEPRLVCVETNPGPPLYELDDFSNILSVIAEFILSRESDFRSNLAIIHLVKKYHSIYLDRFRMQHHVSIYGVDLPWHAVKYAFHRYYSLSCYIYYNDIYYFTNERLCGIVDLLAIYDRMSKSIVNCDNIDDFPYILVDTFEYLYGYDEFWFSMNFSIMNKSMNAKFLKRCRTYETVQIQLQHFRTPRYLKIIKEATKCRMLNYNNNSKLGVLEELLSMYLSPAARLVCVESNPGPSCSDIDDFPCILELVLDYLVSTEGVNYTLRFVIDRSSSMTRTALDYPRSLEDDLFFVDYMMMEYKIKDAKLQFDMHWNYMCIAIIELIEEILYMYLYLDEPEDGPVALPLDVLSYVSDYVQFPYPPLKPESGLWGDLDEWEDEIADYKNEACDTIGAVMDTFCCVDSVPDTHFPCMNSVLKSLLPTDILGTSEISESMRQSTERLASVVDTSVDRLVGEGIKHVHTVPDELSGFLKTISDNISKFTLPNIGQCVDLFCSAFPGAEGLKELWNESLDPRAKQVLILSVLGTMSCVAAKYELNWKTKLFVCAMQWGIAIRTGDDMVKKTLALMHGLEVTAHVVVAIIPLIQSWFLNPEAEYEAHAKPLLEHISFTTKHVIPVFVKSVIAATTFSKTTCDVESLMSSCQLYKKLTNGFEFTVSAMVDLVRRIFDMLGSTVGFKLFQEAYNDYPELYRVMENFDGILEKLTTGQRLTHSDLSSFKKHSALLLGVEKRLALKAADAVYQSQVRALRTACDSLRKAFGCQGLRANNFRLRPFVISLAGPSAIGKTLLMRLIMNSLAKFTSIGDDIQDFIDHPETYIHMWSECEFHDNMLPETVFLGIDDFAQTRKAMTPETCPMRGMIGINNNAPDPVNCSDNNRKNTIFHTEEVVITSFNRDRFKVDDFHVYQIEAALNRLGLCVQVLIKERFRKTQGPEIDKNWGYTLDKTKAGDALNVNVYDFRIYNVHDGSTVCVFDSFSTFMRYVAKCMHEHKQAEILRMNELSNSYFSEDLNPLLGMSMDDIIEDTHEARMNNEEVETLIRAALNEYKAREAERSESFNALSEEYRARFNYRMADPTNPLWYFSIVDGLFWQKVYSQDPGWANFVDQHIGDLFGWMAGDTGTRLFKTTYWKQFSPTEIPHDVEVICRLLRLYYLRTKEMCCRYELAFKDIFNVAKKMDINKFLRVSYSVVKDLAYMELKDSLVILGDTYLGLFSFCGAWTRQVLIMLPALVSSAYVVDTVVARSGVRMRNVKIKPRKPPVLAKVIPSTIGEHIATSVDISKMAMQAAATIHKHNEYGILVEMDGKQVWVQSIIFLEGRVALGNTHLARMADTLASHNAEFTITLLNYHSKQEIPVMWKWIRTRHMDRSDKTFYVFHLMSNIHNHRSIVKYMVDESVRIEEGTNVLISLNRCDNLPDVERVLVVRPIRRVSHIAYHGDVDDLYTYVGFDIDFPSQKGDCGSTVYLSDSKCASSWHMIGIIAAGKVKERYVTMTPLSRQWIRRNLDDIHSKFEAWMGMKLVDELEIPNESFSCSAIPSKFIIERKDKPVSQSDRTKYKKTKMFGLFSEVTRYPAVQIPYEFDGVDFDPPYLARDKYCNSSGVYNPLIMMYATTMYLITLLPILFGDYHHKPREFTPEEVTVGNGYVDATPRNTSEGYAYQLKGVSKKMLFGTGVDYDITNSYCREMLSNVHSAIVLGNKGHVMRRVAKDFGKDETLDCSKIAKGKLRLVSGTDVEDFTEDKCRLGYAVSLITSNPIYSGTAAGLNPYSTDWDKMYHYFDGFGIIAGDFKNPNRLSDQPGGATCQATRPEKTDGAARCSWGLGL